MKTKPDTAMPFPYPRAGHGIVVSILKTAIFGKILIHKTLINVPCVTVQRVECADPRSHKHTS